MVAPAGIQPDIQPYQETQLKNLQADVRSLAAQKRLEAIFDVELYAFSRTIEAVMAAPTKSTVESALKEGRTLLKRLREAPDKSSSDILLR